MTQLLEPTPTADPWIPAPKGIPGSGAPVAQVAQVISPAPPAAWRDVLAADPGATALQRPEYQQAVLRAGGGQDASRLYVLTDGRLLLLPLVRRPLPGLRLAADFPGGFGHGSLLATGGLRPEDVRTVVADLRRTQTSVRIGGGHHTADAWSAALGLPGVHEERRRVDVVDLSMGWDRYLSTAVHRGARQNLHKSQRRGVEIERDSTGRLLPVFHELYRAWVERSLDRSGLPPAVARWSALRQEPYEKFAAVVGAMGGSCRIFVAWFEGRAVASCITFVHGDHAIGWRSYSLKDLGGRVAANTATQLAGLRDACESGCRFFDLGQSGDKENLQQYKSSLGAVPRRVVDLRIEPEPLARLRSGADRGKQLIISGVGRLAR